MIFTVPALSVPGQRITVTDTIKGTSAPRFEYRGDGDVKGVGAGVKGVSFTSICLQNEAQQQQLLQQERSGPQGAKEWEALHGGGAVQPHVKPPGWGGRPDAVALESVETKTEAAITKFETNAEAALKAAIEEFETTALSKGESVVKSLEERLTKAETRLQAVETRTEKVKEVESQMEAKLQAAEAQLAKARADGVLSDHPEARRIEADAETQISGMGKGAAEFANTADADFKSVQKFRRIAKTCQK